MSSPCNMQKYLNVTCNVVSSLRPCAVQQEHVQDEVACLTQGWVRFRIDRTVLAFLAFYKSPMSMYPYFF